MTGFGWSLPPGCGATPGDEMLPPCCDECPEDTYAKCPGEDNCAEFQKTVIDASKSDDQMYNDHIEAIKTSKEAGHVSMNKVI